MQACIGASVEEIGELQVEELKTTLYLSIYEER